MKKTKIFNPLSEYKLEIFGLSALMIIYHHLGNRGVLGLTMLPEVMQNTLRFILLKSNIGVDVFVFLSALGLYYSMEHNSVFRFYVNRIRRVFVSWFVIMAPVFIFEDFFLEKDGIVGFLLDITTIRYWVDNPNTHTPWFVPFIIALYLIFPLLYYLDKKSRHYGTVALLVLTSALVIAFDFYPNPFYTQFVFPLARVPVFLAGMLSAVYFTDKKPISKRFAIITLIMSLGVYVLWYFLNLKTGFDFLVGSFAAVCMVILYSYFRNQIKENLITRVFTICGTVSLEIYLIHTVILRVVDNNELSEIVFASMYILIPIVSVLLSKLVLIIVKHVNRLFERKVPEK